MITTHIPQGFKETEKDGVKSKVLALPNELLRFKGAVITVIITHPADVVEKSGVPAGKMKSIQVNALIDSGATGSVITQNIAEQLGLLQTGFQPITSVNNQEVQPVYYAQIVLPWGSSKPVRVVACPLKGYDCLIGRDIMAHWNFTYNGKDGFFTICD